MWSPDGPCGSRRPSGSRQPALARGTGSARSPSLPLRSAKNWLLTSSELAGKGEGSARAKPSTVLPGPPAGQGHQAWGQEGRGGVGTDGAPRGAMSCVSLGVSIVTTSHNHAVTASEALPTQRGHGGVAPPTPHWQSSAGAASSPTEMPLSGESQGGSRHTLPSLSCPGSVTPAALPAQTRLTRRRQRWPSRARRSQPGCGAGGARPPPPERWQRTQRPAGKGPGEGERVPGSVPRGMETPGAGASPRVSQESASAPLSRAAVAATARHLQIP